MESIVIRLNAQQFVVQYAKAEILPFYANDKIGLCNHLVLIACIFLMNMLTSLIRSVKCMFANEENRSFISIQNRCLQ